MTARGLIMALAAASISLIAAPGSTNEPGTAQVEPTFFGMHVNKISSLPLTIPVGSLRLWDTATNWNQLCPTSDYSQCDWRHLDEWLAAAKSNGISEVVYTFGRTPDWVSTEPRGDCGKEKFGICYPPRDLTADGGGTDSAFRGFVTALVKHNQLLDPSRFAKIKFWSIWNEPNAQHFWRGTAAQLVRMAKDARPIIQSADPTALVLTPEPSCTSPHNDMNSAEGWLDDYLAKGGGQYADVVAFHSYARNNGGYPSPESVVSMIEYVKAQVARHPEVKGKALWMTEGSWGRSDKTSWNGEGDDAGAFLIRYDVLIASEGIERMYWYGWDLPGGTLWANGKALPVTNAYRQAHDWLVGRTVDRCTSQSHVWSCDISAAGYKGRIVWDEEYRKTTSYNTGNFSAYRSTAGEHGSIDPKTHLINIGNSPVLVEKPL